jgi:hypothetical protein
VTADRCRTTGKVRFTSWAKAMERVCEIMRDPERTERIPLRVHRRRCEWCLGWHLTSQDACRRR